MSVIVQVHECRHGSSVTGGNCLVCDMQKEHAEYDRLAAANAALAERVAAKEGLVQTMTETITRLREERDAARAEIANLATLLSTAEFEHSAALARAQAAEADRDIWKKVACEPSGELMEASLASQLLDVRQRLAAAEGALGEAWPKPRVHADADGLWLEWCFGNQGAPDSWRLLLSGDETGLSLSRITMTGSAVYAFDEAEAELARWLGEGMRARAALPAPGRGAEKEDGKL